MTPSNSTSAAAWKCGNEFAAYHPQASHVPPDYRDGWNHCYKAAQAQLADLTREVEEQARLNGMGSEREAALLAKVEALTRERDYARARIDRAVKAAEDVFGEDAVRYKLCLRDDGRATNHFPAHMDGGWFAFQRAEDDAHVGLCDEIVRLRAELAALKASTQAPRVPAGCNCWSDERCTCTPAETAGPQPLTDERITELTSSVRDSFTGPAMLYEYSRKLVRVAERELGIGAAKEKTE